MDRRAQKLGLAIGLALADARARIPLLDVQDMDEAADATFLVALADFCDRYTPLTTLDGTDGLVLDITGCAHLFDGEHNLRADLLERLKKAKIETHASIASTPDAARALARFGGQAIAAPGTEAVAVQALPVVALGTSPDTISGLFRAGLKTIGDLAERPRQPLAARFGESLILQLARTLGEKDARITPRRPVPPYRVEQRFADPIGLQDDIALTLDTLAQHLANLLERQGQSGRYYEAVFFRADGHVFRIAIETGNAQRDPQIIMRLFNERLASLSDPFDPGFGFDMIQLSASNIESFSSLQTSFDNIARQQEEIERLTDRLSVRFGSQAVKKFIAVDTHIPESAMQMIPAQGAPIKPGVGWDMFSASGAPIRPIHLFNPPQPIEALAEVPDGPPLRFRWRQVLHEIGRAEGPERIAAEWWHNNGFSHTSMTRDYYRIEDRQGRRYWVFREGLYGTESLIPSWFLHGVFA
ncbi:DNA polymerase Y family protein [Devosia rhodophyticola]|uniref:DNA polymerase Y family protein n=1 Tax=Devosia rhodophyticola TaxID=3026423 RepID=A0ABY7Z1H2_9HYPH|nr:DNA polymerase Y family protein [Devosia rhodophyticola]